MTSSPLPSAPLADRLAWLAGEVRSEKADAGMIVALFMEVFARLLSRLAGLAGRVEAVAPPRPEPRATPVAAAAPIVAGLLPRVLGWLGGMLPVGDPLWGEMRSDRPATLSGRQSPFPTVGCSERPRLPSLPDLIRQSNNRAKVGSCTWIAGSSPAMTVIEGVAAKYNEPDTNDGGWVPAWRLVPAATAGPIFKNATFLNGGSTPISLRYRNQLAFMAMASAASACVQHHRGPGQRAAVAA